MLETEYRMRDRSGYLREEGYLRRNKKRMLKTSFSGYQASITKTSDARAMRPGRCCPDSVFYSETYAMRSIEVIGMRAARPASASNLILQT
jgi:hypothetical protein